MRKNTQKALGKNLASFRKALRFGTWGAVGGAVGSLFGEIMDNHRSSWAVGIFEVGVWFGIVSTCITTSILAGYSHYLRKGVSFRQSIKDGTLFGFLSGMIAGAIAQGIYAGVGPTEPLHVACWGVAGGLLGYGLSFHVPNLNWQHALWGGGSGGLVGGCLFILLTILVGDIVGRLFGLLSIGFSIGATIVLVEEVFRTAWLEVSYDPRENLTISLGAEPISIGSNSEVCTVYVPNVPPVALRYNLQQGQIVYEEVETGMRGNVLPGDRRTVGKILVTVYATKDKNAIEPVSEVSTPSSPWWVNDFSLRLSSGRKIQLLEGTRLTETDLSGIEAKLSGQIVAEVHRNPEDLMNLELRNSSSRSWLMANPNGERREIKPGQRLSLGIGIQIDFGPTTGEICK